jgi:hypothetical protein
MPIFANMKKPMQTSGGQYNWDKKFHYRTKKIPDGMADAVRNLGMLHAIRRKYRG